MKKKNTILKGLLLSVSALIIGFVAISLPFNLFSELSDAAMEIIFMTELIIYFFIGIIFLIVKDKKQQKKRKKVKRLAERQKRIKIVQDEWFAQKTPNTNTI